MGRKRAEQQVVIEGSPHDCFAAITDYDTFEDWQRAVKRCEVLSRDPEGRGKRVRFEVDAKVRSIAYTLDYSYEAPSLITWDYVDGNVREIDGEMVFEDRGDGTTLATYALHIDPGVPLPGPTAKLLNEQVMKGSMEDLKRRVESG